MLSGRCFFLPILEGRAHVHANPNIFDLKLSNTISLKNENTSNQVSNSMLKYNRFTVDDSATVRVITLVTLIYLPPTSVSVCSTLPLLRVLIQRLTKRSILGLFQYGRIFFSPKRRRSTIEYANNSIYMAIFCGGDSSDGIYGGILVVEVEEAEASEREAGDTGFIVGLIRRTSSCMQTQDEKWIFTRFKLHW